MADPPVPAPPAAAAGVAPLGAGLVIDPKFMGKPRTWDGDRKKWKHFAISIRGYVGAISPDLLRMMRIAQTQDEQITHAKHAFHNLTQTRDQVRVGCRV